MPDDDPLEVTPVRGVEGMPGYEAGFILGFRAGVRRALAVLRVLRLRERVPLEEVEREVESVRRQTGT